jgi:5-methylcytosine-specific restriction enzyme subunit McrC
MPRSKAIQVFEYGRLIVGEEYGPDKIVFTKTHLDDLAKYLTHNQGCPFYTLYYDRVKFNQYVGVIQVDGLTIEVLPKTDKHEDNTELWQQALIRMLFISLQVNARTTTISSINIKKLTVLEAYLLLFLDEVQILMHHGLVKKYHTNISNQTSLKGKLLIHEQVTKNIVHAERFYVAHQVYGKDNVYNSILKEALDCINDLSVNNLIKSKCSNILLDFLDCKPVNIQEKLFDRLQYDRKTDRYKTAIELAKIILLNYHPDFKGGYSNILAIMVDMNILWENYIYYTLKRTCNAENSTIQVYPQQKALFWRHPENWSLRLKPDLLLEKRDEKEVVRRLVLDTKWKYQSDAAVEDVRQMYAYNHYFKATESYLLYPDKLIGRSVEKYPGNFYIPGTDNFGPESKCGLLYVDLLDKDGNLNLEVGADLIRSFSSSKLL